MMLKRSGSSTTILPMRGRWLPWCILFLMALLVPQFLHAQDIARLQTGVVKITAKPPSGTANVGTGFIVRMDKDAAYIVTAAHVVAGGDTHPKVEFFTKRNLPVTAEVLGLEGGDEVRGLALLVVRGAENLPNGLAALSLAGTTRFTGGEDILVIGFPRGAGPWALIKGNISSRQGRDVFFSPTVDSGHSGGPIFQDGKVVGVVGAGHQSVGRGVTARSVQDYIEGFGITA
jgi:S1-C subfamily serine protease